MSIKQVNPYLNFDGTAAKAIKLYETALGAKVETMSTFADAGQMGHPTDPQYKDRVMHALLRIGDAPIMISDGMPGVPVPTQSNVQISLDFADAAEMAQRFEALAAGGRITMPLNDTFWGAKFGMLTDAYSISWMFNCDIKKP